MKLKINIFTTTLTLMAAISVLLSSCANEVAPTGGPKDETPPKVLKYSPEIYSTNFNGKTIEITFDEFFQLNNYKSKLLISPPFQNEPTFTVKGKKLIINLKDDPIPNTTYKIFLGDAIVDGLQLGIGILVLAEVQHAHVYVFGLLPHGTDDPETQQKGSGVYAEYDALLIQCGRSRYTDGGIPGWRHTRLSGCLPGGRPLRAEARGSCR